MKGAPRINFDTALNRGMKLIKQGGNKKNLGLLIVSGIYCGLRIGDLTNLKFEQLRKDTFTMKETKNKNHREIPVHKDIHKALKHFDNDITGYAFMSQMGCKYSRSQVNRLLKVVFNDETISTHSLRKAFGYRYWEANGKSEASLLELCDVFGHKNLATTIIYIGLRQEQFVLSYGNM